MSSCTTSKTRILFLLLLTLVWGAVTAVVADDRLDKLSEEHRLWLERDVRYIITDRERDVFLTLTTLEERERFIEAFWRKRDPNLATPINEFQEEHYARLEYVDKFLGRETFRQGWQTDRGRYYIILGKPREVQRFDGYNELVSTELWFYQGDTRLGIPNFFYLLFFKRNDIGEYELYHPIIDGPGALLQGSQYTPGADNLAALEALDAISPELAQASLSFDTSDPPDFISGRASLGTDMVMARIEESPKRAIRADYADAYLLYGNRVSADYSFNYIPSRSSFGVIVGPQSTPFVHFSVEIDPQNFTLETDEDKTKYYTTLDVSVEVRDPDGTLVVATSREAYLELTPGQIQQVQQYPFAYQDDLPLVPGDYTVSVILRNRVVTQYTVAEAELSLADFSSGEPHLADVILGYGVQMVGGELPPDEIRTFQLGSRRIQPSANREFAIGDTLHVMTQANVAPEGATIRFRLRNGDEELQTVEGELDDNGVAVEPLALTGMVGGTYEIRAELVSGDGQLLTRKSVPLTLSPRSALPRPGFVYRRGFNATFPGLLSLARGEQLWNLGRYDEARVELEKAVAADNPRLPNARWKLATAYLRDEDADKALALLAPLEEAFPQQFDVVAGLGFCYYFKSDFAKAVSYLERAMSIRPADTTLLNALGDSHQRLGNPERARESFESSLELNPDQTAVKELLAALGKS